MIALPAKKFRPDQRCAYILLQKLLRNVRQRNATVGNHFVLVEFHAGIQSRSLRYPRADAQVTHVVEPTRNANRTIV